MKFVFRAFCLVDRLLETDRKDEITVYVIRISIDYRRHEEVWDKSHKFGKRARGLSMLLNFHITTFIRFVLYCKYTLVEKARKWTHYFSKVLESFLKKN